MERAGQRSTHTSLQALKIKTQSADLRDEMEHSTAQLFEVTCIALALVVVPWVSGEAFREGHRTTRKCRILLTPPPRNISLFRAGAQAVTWTRFCVRQMLPTTVKDIGSTTQPLRSHVRARAFTRRACAHTRQRHVPRARPTPIRLRACPPKPLACALPRGVYVQVRAHRSDAPARSSRRNSQGKHACCGVHTQAARYSQRTHAFSVAVAAAGPACASVCLCV